jgi:hypothetical protein
MIAVMVSATVKKRNAGQERGYFCRQCVGIDSRCGGGLTPAHQG